MTAAQRRRLEELGATASNQTRANWAFSCDHLKRPGEYDCRRMGRWIIKHPNRDSYYCDLHVEDAIQEFLGLYL